MPKIKVNIVLKTPIKTYQYLVPAIYQEQEDYIIYKEPTTDNTLVKFDYKHNELKRDNNKITMCYKFNKNKKTTGTISLKELNKMVTLNIKTTNIIHKSNNIEITYLIEDELYNYKIEVI